MTNDIGLIIDRAIAPTVRRLRARLAVARQHAAAPSKAQHRPQKRKDRLVMKWTAGTHAGRVPHFVQRLTGLKTAHAIVAYYGKGAEFVADVPLPRFSR
jgi:hypothetical protein